MSELVYRQKCPQGPPDHDWTGPCACKGTGFIEVVLPDDKVLEDVWVDTDEFQWDWPARRLATVSDVLAVLDKEVER